MRTIHLALLVLGILASSTKSLAEHLKADIGGDRGGRSDTAAALPPTPTATLTPTSTQSSASAAGCIGWATQNGGTTGGEGGATVTVTNKADFTTY